MTSREELQTLAGTDPVLELMLLENKPLTRETYLAMAYPDNLPSEFPAELEADLPEPFQVQTVGS